MTVDTIAHVRDRLVDAGFTETLAADDCALLVSSSGERYAPGDLVVDQLIRFGGISAEEEEGLLFALATADGGPLGTYVPAYRPAASTVDAAIVEQLHARVISDEELQAHARHDHIAALFDDHTSAQAAVDALRQLGLGSDKLGLAVHEGADR